MDVTPPAFGRADLSSCDREPIHIPGSIEPHGILIVFDPGNSEIVQIAGDTEKVFGQPKENFIGQRLRAYIGSAAQIKLVGRFNQFERI